MEAKQQYKHKTFNSTDLKQEEEFSKYDAITFIGCTFMGKVEFKQNTDLRFSHCEFKNEWKHIICEKIVYSKCKFEKFEYQNISKEKDISKDSQLFDCTFTSIDCEGIIFKKPFIKIVDEKKSKHIDVIKFVHCEFEDDFILKVSDNSDRDELIEIKFDSIDLTDSTFHKKFKMQYCSVENESILYNTKFKDLADFYKTKFNEVIFERTDFEGISVFSKANFNNDVNFKYTKFLGKSIFRDTVIKGKLNLRDAIFDDEATFLDITKEERKEDDNREYYGEPKVINVANRETARVIKNFYDKSNNIIEANKFYALEMKEREKELDKDKKSNFFEWIVIKLHGESSEHSQNWMLALFWIVMFSMFYTYESHGIQLMTFFITYFSIIYIIMYKTRKYNLFTKYFNIFMPFLFAISLFYFINIWKFINIISLSLVNEIAKNIYPFSKIETDMTFGLLLFKITMAYLIYQFIVSVRQNTRRK
ncbi:pentapeptide repeat-containing protein [Sulfurimonas sp.]|uniref:pentapeptide repeat-containing protein n=1 Tax=Sulfurimonas sp. TaxID=2022749 RepID=UPI0025E69ACE|nr:pentapeptide repeat-containing protein [Sulfurimonas sp.]